MFLCGRVQRVHDLLCLRGCHFLSIFLCPVMLQCFACLGDVSQADLLGRYQIIEKGLDILPALKRPGFLLQRLRGRGSHGLASASVGSCFDGVARAVRGSSTRLPWLTPPLQQAQSFPGLKTTVCRAHPIREVAGFLRDRCTFGLCPAVHLRPHLAIILIFILRVHARVRVRPVVTQPGG